jgi:YVTN family beta-propeller protein
MQQRLSRVARVMAANSFSWSRSAPRIIGLGLALVLLAIGGCSDDPVEPPLEDLGDGSYSDSIQRIFDASCLTSGCHGSVSPGSDLKLTSWETLIAGGDHGEVIIPFWPDESHLLDHLTRRAEPQMPLSGDPLSDAQIGMVRRWVADGARNDAGVVPYADSRRKIYVTNQGSDKITIIDADAMVVIGLINVGAEDVQDVPHNVHVDAQGRYFYVSLINSARLLQFDAATDQLLNEVTVGQSPANPVTSPDGETVYVTNWNPDNPTLHVLDAETLSERYVLRFPDSIGELPHGLLVTGDGGTLYTTHEGAGSVFKIELGETAEEAVLTYIPLGEPASLLRPLQVLLDAEERFLYVTCNGSGEVRVVDTESQEMIEVLPIGGRPWLEALTPDGRYIYVGNWGKDGVDVIDTSTIEVVESLTNASAGDHAFARPHGVAITSDGRHVFVSNENTNGAIPQHHPTEGGGDNGYTTVIEVATNQVIRVLEVEVDPTGVAFVELP